MPSPLPNRLSSLRPYLIQALSISHGKTEAPMLARLLLESLELDQQAGPQELSERQLESLQERLERLFRGEPIQHITGLGHFYGRDFVVASEVLIPRQETEELMVWARDTLSQLPSHQPLRILDIGTGSGCLAISLALELKARGYQTQVHACDRSEAALEIARRNAQLMGAQVHCFHQNIFSARQHQFSDLDLIISNPPYIPEGEWQHVQAQVRNYEPQEALFVPDETPLRFYRQIARLAAHWLKAQAWLMVEIHESMGEAACRLLERSFEIVELRQDLRGKDRMIRARSLTEKKTEDPTA